MQIYDSPELILSRSFVCCNFMNYPFRKVFCNLEISKLHSPEGVFNTVYALILEQSLVPKILFFLFLRPVTNTHFSDHL